MPKKKSHDTDNFILSYMKKKVLVISEASVGGEWNALTRMLSAFSLYMPIDLTYIGIVPLNGRMILPKKTMFTLIHLIQSNVGRPFQYVRTQFFLIINIFRAVSTIISRDKDFDGIIVCHYLAVYALLMDVVHRPLKKTVYVFHGWKRELEGAHRRAYWNLLTIILERLALLLSPVIIVPSLHTKDMLRRELFPFGHLKDIQIVQNRVPNIYFQFKKTDRSHTRTVRVFYCGSIVPFKGLDRIIEALSLVGKKNIHVHLTIMFPKETVDRVYMKKIRSMIRTRGLSHSITFLQSPSEKKRISIYGKCDIGVLPSLFEIQPLVLLESLASGTPVIGSQVGDMAGILRSIDPHLLLSDRSPESIARALLYYRGLSFKEKRKLSVLSYNMARHFTKQTCGLKMKSISSRLWS